MNKLGIAIVVTGNGMGEPLVANPGDWTRRVGDIRPVLARVAPPCSPEMPLIYMTFSADGTFIVVARAVSGRLGDNVAAWLFIPDGIQISGGEVSDVIGRLERLIKSDRLPDEAALEREFADSYASLTDRPGQFASESDGPLAWRGIKGYGLENLAGTFRRLPCYAEYCGVVLADEDQTVAGAVDMSDCPLDGGDTVADAVDSEDSIDENQVVGLHSDTRLRFGLCRQWQPYAVGAVVGFVFALLLVWIAGYCRSHTFGLQAAWPPVKVVEIIPESVDTVVVASADTVVRPYFSARQLAEAVAYLDSHKVWNRADMDSIVPLKGLWDALNECRYDVVTEYRRRLDGSAVLKAMADTLAVCGTDSLCGKPLNIEDNINISVEDYGRIISAAREALNIRK